MQVCAEKAKATIDCEMKKRGLKYIFYETSAATGQNLDEFKKQFGVCLLKVHAHIACSNFQ